VTGAVSTAFGLRVAGAGALDSKMRQTAKQSRCDVTKRSPLRLDQNGRQSRARTLNPA
jgi:hypothetical protein